MVKRHADWISVRQASRILASSRATVARLAESGLIGSRRIPGTHPLVLRADVEKLAEKSTRHSLSQGA